MRKVKKWRPRNDIEKNVKFGSKFGPKMGACGRQTDRFATYLSQNKGFGVVAKIDEKWTPKLFKKAKKCDQKSSGRRIFEILGRSGRRCFIDVFGDRKKSAQNPEKSAGGATKRISGLFFGRPGGMCGAAGEVRRGSEPLRARQGSWPGI